MKKLWALFNLFRKGSAVADPALWKHGQITVTVLLPFAVALIATVRAFGYEIPVSDELLAQGVGGLVVVINVVLTVITSDKIGLPAGGETDPDRRVDADTS